MVNEIVEGEPKKPENSVVNGIVSKFGIPIAGTFIWEIFENLIIEPIIRGRRKL